MAERQRTNDRTSSRDDGLRLDYRGTLNLHDRATLNSNRGNGRDSAKIIFYHCRERNSWTALAKPTLICRPTAKPNTSDSTREVASQPMSA
jgi:hypothetical protein